MAQRCPKCKGRGKVVKETASCPTCLGIGKTTFQIGQKGGEICQKCNGKGKIKIFETCPVCEGKKQVYYCDNCKKTMTEKDESGLCLTCRSQENPTVYVLKPPIDPDLIRLNMLMLGRVDAQKSVGVFVDLSDKVNLLIGSNDVTNDYAWDRGEEVIVRVKNIKSGNKIYGEPVVLEDYSLESLRGTVTTISIAELQKRRMGSFISFKGQVVSVLQTSGPTRFTIVDETGSINGVAFVKAGERAFPEIKEDAAVQVFGEISKFKESVQIEISDIERLKEKEAMEILNKIAKAIDIKAKPAQINYSIKSKLLEKIRPELEKAAKRIRKTIYTGQPILIRHHADADGAVAGFCLHYALMKMMEEEEGFDSDTIRLRIKRLPNKPPFFELIDAVKDLEFALSDKERFGDKLPLFVCMDFGSSTESIVAYKKIKALDLDIVVIDHHFPDEEIRALVDVHVNPYWQEGGYEICGGMLGYELARLIYPNISEDLKHLPAVAGLMDRVEGEEIGKYLKLAKEKGYSKEELKKIGMATDYELYQLRFSEGTNLLKILFNVDTKEGWHTKMYKLLGEEAQNLFDEALRATLPHVEEKTLTNDILLTTIDVDLYTARFSFPAPGKLTGLLFDEFCKKNPEKAVVTLGLGPDFMILRSKDVKINFPEAVKTMQESMPASGVNGGGHEVVGSLKYYEGVRDQVISFFIDYLSKLDIKT